MVVDRQYSATKQRVETLQKSVASNEKALLAKQEDLGNSQKRYDALNKDYAKVSNNRDLVVKELDKDKQAILDDSKTLSNLQTELSSTQTDLQQAKGDLAKTQTDLGHAQDALRDAFAQLNVDVPMENQFLQQPVIFNVGEEVARISVPAEVKPAEAGSYVDQLMNKASELALQRGAVTSKLGEGRAAGFMKVLARTLRAAH